MLRTIYQIGKNIGGDKTPWDDIVSSPVSPKDREKRKYVMPINFDLDKGEVTLSLDGMFEFDEAELVKLRSLKIQGGNNKSIYIAIDPQKQDQLIKTLFGKADKGVYPERGEFLGAIDDVAPALAGSQLYQVLTQIPSCREAFLQLIKDEEGKFSLSKCVSKGLGKQDVITLVVATVSSESLALANVPIGHLDGYETFVEKKFFSKMTKKEGTESKLCYATGEFRTDVQEAEFSNRYNINKFFVKTTINYATDFDESRYARNYQLSTDVEIALNRGSEYLLNNAVIKIAGVRHLVIPEFFNQNEIEFPIKLKAQSELLFDFASKEEVFTQEDYSETEGLYWINYIAIDSDGNYFKVGNQIKDVSQLHLKNIEQALKRSRLAFRPWLNDTSFFNLYTIYKSIPIRDDKQKNAALHLFKLLLEQRKISKQSLMTHFKELILCHWHQRYAGYANISPMDKDKFDFAARDAVFKYMAFMHALSELDLLEPTIKFKQMEDNKPSSIAQEEEAFLKAMDYSTEQKALFYLGRALHRLVSAQNQKSHKKNALDKLNYNGMDKHAIQRFANELFEASRHYGISDKIAWSWGAFGRSFDFNNWHVDPQEALFYILSGYTYLIKSKVQDENETINENQD